MIKKIISACVTLSLVLSCSAFAYAYSSTVTAVNRIDYADGSYAIVTTTENVQSSLTRTTQQKSGSKTYEYYQGSVCEWTFTIKGTFTFDGTTAKASSPSCSTSINVTGWTCTNKNATASGNSITGSATMKKSGVPKSITLTLTCSPTGTLS